MKLVFPRRGLGAVAVAALGSGLWLAGDLLTLGDTRPFDLPGERLAGIAALVVLWLAFEIFATWRASRANRRLLDGIAGAGTDGRTRSAHEVAELARRFDEAAQLLKKTRFRDRDGERRYLHELPWYVFIGAPGSGKTTALINSGLHFVLGGKDGAQAVKGVGGTRNCDWWFTREAVLLDTAGRYTTQDSEREVDSAAWTGFLDLLKKFRRNQPLSGALVTLSISELLYASAEERERYASQVRSRVRELYDRLGVEFPVYLLVTKLDLLAGFMEFLGELEREQRAQVWGVTFADGRSLHTSAGIGSIFAAEFVQLERRLYSLLLGRLSEERDVQRRSLIYSFPQQFSGTGSLIGEFLDRAFGPGRDRLRPQIRGVYFTSGTQEGTPIDRVIGTLSRTFKLEHKVLQPAFSSGKSFFLTRLLRDVIFREAGLAGADEQRDRRHRLLAWSGTAACVALTVIIASAWAASYLANRALVADSEAKAAALHKDMDAFSERDADLALVVKVLNGLRELPGGYADRGKPVDLMLGLGLYQGEKIGDLALRAYRNALRDVLLPQVALLMEKSIARARGEELQAALNAYLMLYHDQLFEPKSLESSAGAVIEAALASAGKAALSEDFKAHLGASLEMRPFEMLRPRNDELVAAARRRLPRTGS